jgi:hypothetical protein
MPMKTMTFSDANRDFGFLASESPGRISREQTTLAGPRLTDLMPGTVLGRSPKGAASAFAGPTISGSGAPAGNGVMGAVTVTAGAPAGTYQVRILNPQANAGAFEVYRPDGSVDGDGVVGQPYNGSIAFTLADGSVDFVEDDRVPVTVTYAAANGQVSPLNLAALNDSQIADSILGMRQPAGTAPKRCAVVARHCEVIDNLIIWPAGITADQKAKGIAQLAAKGIIVRPNV